jgi:hypothetical protein
VHWFAVMAAGATVGLVKKMIARYRRGAEIPHILHDPPEIRTLACFELEDPARLPGLLDDVAQALAPDVEAWATSEHVVKARRRDHDVDVLRLVHRGEAVYTLELTRAWTGPRLGAAARTLLERVHEVLSGHAAIGALAWHWRQDRALANGHPCPVTPALPTSSSPDHTSG